MLPRAERCGESDAPGSIAAMSWLRSVVPVTLLLLPLAACLDFDEQEIRIVADAERDRLDLLLVYRGVYDDGGKDTEQQLEALLRGERWFALGSNFPFQFRLDPPARGDDDWFLPLLAAHATVENGAFFRDAQGRLCAWQCVRFARVSEVLERGNAETRAALAAAEVRRELLEDLGVRDEASHALLAAAQAADFRFLERRAGALVVRLPLSREGHGQLVDHVLREGIGLAQSASNGDRHAAELDFAVRLLAGCELSFVRAGEATELILGNQERAEQAIRVPARDRYRDNLEPLLTERGLAIRDDVDEAALAEAFAVFRARE